MGATGVTNCARPANLGYESTRSFSPHVRRNSEEYESNDDFFLQREASYRGLLTEVLSRTAPDESKATARRLGPFVGHASVGARATPLGATTRRTSKRRGRSGECCEGIARQPISPVSSINSLSLYVYQLLST